MSELACDVKLGRYGFSVSFTTAREYSGFYWVASAPESEEVGMIDFSVLGKQTEIFVETSFSPVKVETVPIRSASRSLAYKACAIYPGRWELSFMNLRKSSSSLKILGVVAGTNDGVELIDVADLTEVGRVRVGFSSRLVFDKMFVKKSNFSPDAASFGDFSLLSSKSTKLISDESLISPEYECVKAVDGRVEFAENSPIWSYFAIRFYEL